MAAQPLSNRVRDVVAPVVTESGLYLEDVEVHPAGRRTLVRITLDLDEDATGGLGLDAVAEVSRAISAALDAAGTIRGEHVLEVGSPGVSRPLTDVRHFKRARGRVVTLTLVDGAQDTGRLVAADAVHLTLGDATATGGDPEARTRTHPFASVVRGRVEVEMARLAELGDDDDEDGDVDDAAETEA